MPALLRYAHQGTILMPTWQYRYATVRSSQTPIQRQREKPQHNQSKKKSLKTKITLISPPLHTLSLPLSLALHIELFRKCGERVYLSKKRVSYHQVQISVTLISLFLQFFSALILMLLLYLMISSLSLFCLDLNEYIIRFCWLQMLRYL